jgi:hypothetical protein
MRPEAVAAIAVPVVVRVRQVHQNLSLAEGAGNAGVE